MSQKYTYDGLDVVLDDSNGTLTKYQNGPGIDDKLKSVSGTTTKYFLDDMLGSSVKLVNAGLFGGVSDSNTYDSFGNRTNTSFSSRYQYTGREWDTTTGLQYSRARWYDPQIGRFISEDPIGFRGGDANLYGYVGNNPAMLRDPSGEIPVWDNYWHWHYARQCAASGIANACAANGSGQSQEDLERMAQDAFDQGVGSVSGLRFKVGYGDNDACRQAEYYSGQVWADTFPTNIRRFDPENPDLDETIKRIAMTRPTSKLSRAWNWIKTWF